MGDICGVCGGTRITDCPECHCTACAGRGIVRCRQCKGRKVIVCPLCEGTGFIKGKIFIITIKKACPDCSSMKTVECPGCDGEGTKTCKRCGGEKFAGECPVCGSSRKIPCPECMDPIQLSKQREEGIKYLELGKKSFEKNSLLEAEDYFREAVKSAPNEPEFLTALGSILFHIGMEAARYGRDWGQCYREAMSFLKTATELDDTQFLAHFNLGIVQLTFARFSSERYTNAISAFEKAAALRPDDDRTYSNLATAYFYDSAGWDDSLEKFNSALENCEKALNLNPKNKSARELKSYLLEIKSDLEAIESEDLRSEMKSRIEEYQNR